ncbi:MAG: LysR substrate-binding domain-containing protein [Hyphomicrobiaceae bacterium]|nr:LysR substrate-binding domain-containing protein [Hyphomicrobiaceae bacterium]
MRRLPPFDALVALDSSLRHRSVTLAARELGLTQSAISHRLKRLERFMGTPLLRRSAHGLLPTRAGVALAEGLSDLLDQMAELRARARATAPGAALKVGLGAALAEHWLLSRLPELARTHPGIDLEIMIAESEAHARALDLDVQVLWRPAGQARNTSTQRVLFRETVFPVAPSHLLPQRKPLRNVQLLSRLPIVHKGRAGPDVGAEWSWDVWFQRLGVDGPVPGGLRFDGIATALSAAQRGLGLVLARSLLVADALAEGRLVRVLPATWDMPSSKVHLVKWPAALASDPRVRAFARWIADEAKATAC